jgi:pyruvate/2-oxoglutarate dehydrogenase complex dihydrolipoamide dehydrogenase (E3) component
MNVHASSATANEGHYDLLVVGAGQGGVPLAGAFARAGRRVALVERIHVGGTCINEGCSPTKTVIASARVAHVTRRAPVYGVQIASSAEAEQGPASSVVVNLRRVHERKQQIVDSFRSGSERSLASAGVELIRGTARFVGPRTVHVTEEHGSLGDRRARTLTADTVVINTGLRAVVPPLPGLDDVPYLTSTSILELIERPAHLIVLGGGYVGLEFAQAFRRFGSRVTIMQRDAQLLPREDADVADAVTGILRDEGIDVLLSAEAMRVQRAGGGVRLTWREGGGDGAERTTDGSHLLVATGRTPNTDDLGLDAAGVETDQRGYVRVNERLETSVPGIYAIGDVKGGPAFTHISYDDFRVLRTNLLDGGHATTSGRLVPYTLFLDPQLGAIGITEREARAAGRRVRVAKLPMSSVARALEVDETRGFMKAVVDTDTNQILGATVLGLEGGEIATLFQIAMMGRLPYTALRDGVFSHPTLAEALNNLFTAMDRDGNGTG